MNRRGWESGRHKLLRSMRQRGVAFLLTMLMSMTGITTFAYDAKVNGIYYDFPGNFATVSYYSSSSSSNKTAYTGAVTIPESVTYNGTTYSVSSINYKAFNGCSGLTSVTIPNSVTSIDSYAFSGCSGLTSVTIPNSVTRIGREAFYDTGWYDNQPDGVVYAGKVAYKYKGTMPNNTIITIEEGTLGIADDAFKGCSGLTSVNIPNSVTSIGDDAFFRCSGLTSVTIPNSVTRIGNDAFYYCSGLTSVHISDLSVWCNIKFDSGNPLEYAHHLYLNGEEVSDLVIPDSVMSIGNFTFRGCSGLTSVTIPNSVTYIGRYAFYECI